MAAGDSDRDRERPQEGGDDPDEGLGMEGRAAGRRWVWSRSSVDRGHRPPRKQNATLMSSLVQIA